MVHDSFFRCAMKRMPKTRRRPRRTEIQHHHFLLRMETRSCPSATVEDREAARLLVEQIVRDIDMKLLGEARVYYVESPLYNEGLTALAPIQTSHIAFHFWANPERRILKNSESRCLLEFDLYTCGSLSLPQIQRILHHLTRFRPTHVDATLLNRKYSLTVERKLIWDDRRTANQPRWAQWVSELR